MSKNTQIKCTTQKKQTTQNTAKQIYPGSVTSYNTWLGNEVGLFYKAPGPTRGIQYLVSGKKVSAADMIIYTTK